MMQTREEIILLSQAIDEIDDERQLNAKELIRKVMRKLLDKMEVTQK